MRPEKPGPPDQERWDHRVTSCPFSTSSRARAVPQPPLLVENGHDVTLWSHRPEKAEELRRTRENPMLKGVHLPEAMRFTADLSCVADCGAVLMVTPSYAVRETAAKLRPFLSPGTVVISASKGIEKSTSLRLSQVIEEELEGKCPVVVLSGPSHAEEVGRHIPTGVVAAADRLADAELVQDLFMNKRFRVYTSDDRIGTEICAALNCQSSSKI